MQRKTENGGGPLKNFKPSRGSRQRESSVLKLTFTHLIRQRSVAPCSSPGWPSANVVTCRYRAFLAQTGSELADTRLTASSLRFLSVGSTLALAEANTVLLDYVSSTLQIPDPSLRVPSGWECPPGLGTATLDTILESCKHIRAWLIADRTNVVVGICKLLHRTAVVSACCLPVINALG